MKKSKKSGIVISAVAGIGVLLLILSQFEGESFNAIQSDMEQIDLSQSEKNLFDLPQGKTFGTIDISHFPILGSPDAPVTIMGFGNYQCLGCISWVDETLPEITERLIENGTANYVFVDADIIGDNSLRAAEAAYCANEQERFWEFHVMLFKSQPASEGWGSAEHLKTIALGLELDLDLFGECLDSGKYEEKIRDNVSLAKANGITQTPTFVLVNSEGGHHIIRGAVSLPVFEQVIRNLTP